jgi:hypothetical protein
MLLRSHRDHKSALTPLGTWWRPGNWSQSRIVLRTEIIAVLIRMAAIWQALSPLHQELGFNGRKPPEKNSPDANGAAAPVLCCDGIAGIIRT